MAEAGEWLQLCAARRPIVVLCPSPAALSQRKIGLVEPRSNKIYLEELKLK